MASSVAARSGCWISVARSGATPSLRNTARLRGSAASWGLFSVAKWQYPMVAANPARACSMAGATNSAQGMLPCAACITPSPANAAGTDTLRGPCTAMPLGKASGVAAWGAGPVPL